MKKTLSLGILMTTLVVFTNIGVSEAALWIFQGTKHKTTVTIKLDRAKKPHYWWANATTSISEWTAYCKARSRTVALCSVSGARHTDGRKFYGDIYLSLSDRGRALTYKYDITYRHNKKRYQDTFHLRRIK